jgi:alanine racemase
VPTDSIDARLSSAGLPALPRPVWLEIDEAALANNLAVFRELAGPGVELNAVVKADAYGHGLMPVGRLFESAGTDRLCVASLDEAVALRDAGVRIPVLVLFPIPATEVATAVWHDIEIAISGADQLHATLDCWRGESRAGRLVVHLEIDTGLSRGGVKPEQAAGALGRLAAPDIRVAGIWTHLASPEKADVTAAQVEAFERAIGRVREASLPVPPRHMSATGGALNGKVPRYDGVRIGLGLYGLLPLDLPMPDRERAAAARLVPAMALKARPLRVETISAGTSVSYGGRWTAERESVIATLPVGYGDAIPRPAPWGTALVRGHSVPLVGTVAMDAVMADVTDVPGAPVNLQDEFVLLGEQGGATISAEALARGRNTIPWEVVTSMSARIPRVYHAGSVLMGLRTLNGETRVSTVGASAQGEGNR